MKPTKIKRFTADDIDKVMSALEAAGEHQLHDDFRILLDSVYADGTKRVTFEP